MKKIVLALVVAVVACVVVFASQDVKCRQASHMPYYGQWEPLLLMRVVLLKELI